MEYYQDLDDLKDTFARFLNKVPFYGTGIVCLDEPHVQSIIPRLKRFVMTYGFSRQADVKGSKVKIRGFETRFTVTHKGEALGDIVLNIPGRHNVLNGLAAVAVSVDLGIDFPTIQKALRNFRGTDRRCQLKGEVNGVTVLDDYGHHPTEIRLTLSGIKEGWKRKIIAVFQPHRYTRVNFLMEEFCTSFYEADAVVVTDIYPAGETPIPDVTAEAVTAGITKHGHKDVVLIKDFDEIVDYLARKVEPNDIVVTLGAGTVYQVAEKLVQRLQEKAGGI
jgi:UDP-N-acetylmuramate--alanine ligase